MSIRNLILVFSSGALLAGATHASAQFSSGDLVVSTYGSTTSAPYLDGQATPITLLEYALPTPTSTSLVMSDQLPTTGTGGNVGIVGEYGSSSEGTLQVSGNGQYLTIGGYDGNLAGNGGGSSGYGGTNSTAEAQSTDTNVPRVGALINLSTGSVNTSTVLNDVYNTNNPRSVYSANGTSFLISGQGAGKTDEGGIYSTTVGTNTTTGGAAPTPIFNAVSTRTVTQANFNAVNGTVSSTPNTYYAADQSSSSKGTLTGIFEYSGTPTGSQGSNTGTRITPATSLVNGVTANLSPQAFVFANATTLYVADTGDPKAGGTGDGGIQKWSFSSSLGTWTLDYTLTASTFVSASSATSVSSGETGFEAMALTLNGGNVDIYAVSYTAGDANPNGLYAIVDPLSATTLAGGVSTTTSETTELAAAPGLSNAGGADYNFKGVALTPAAAPEPSTTGMTLIALLGGLLFAWKRNKSQKA
jgi:hypothetical protein